MSRGREKKQQKEMERQQKEFGKQTRGGAAVPAQRVDPRSNPLYPDRVESNAMGILLAIISVIVAIILLVVIVMNFSYITHPERMNSGVFGMAQRPDPAEEAGEIENMEDATAADVPEGGYNGAAAAEDGLTGSGEQMTGADGQQLGEETPVTGPEETQEEPPAQEPVSEEGIHTYEVIVADVSWEQAFEDCINRGGHLLRVNSEEEWNTVITQIQQSGTDAYYFYLGAARAGDDLNYYWQNEQYELYGDPINSELFWGNHLWLEGEPSFADGDQQETVLAILYIKSSNRWVLNDVQMDMLYSEEYLAGKVGYICEYE